MALFPEDIELNSLYKYSLPAGTRQNFLAKLVDTNSSFPYKANDGSKTAETFIDAFSNYPEGEKEKLDLTTILHWLVTKYPQYKYENLRDSALEILRNVVKDPWKVGGKRKKSRKNKRKSKSKTRK